jgi:hypothetical protein
MNPGRYNISVIQGTTFDLKPVWKIGGVAVTLSNYSADMQVRYATDTAIIVELSTANGKITIDSAYGRINLHLSASETAALAPGTYQYQLNITDIDANVTYAILTGNFTVVAAVVY